MGLTRHHLGPFLRRKDVIRAMRIMEGDRLKHKLTGQLYELKIIDKGPFVLESEKTPY